MLLRKIGLILIVIVCSLQAIDLQDVSKNALKEHKLILLSVESENCRYCEKMNKEVFTPTKYAAKISTQYVQKIVNIQDIKLPKNLKVQYYPTNFILDPKDMSIVDEFVGYTKADDFLSLLDLVYEQEL
jgi:thioredoxin-related protein